MTKLIITFAVTMFFLASCNTEPKETVKMVSAPKEKSAKEKQQEIAKFDAELEKSTLELQKQQAEEDKKHYFSFTPKKLKLDYKEDKKNDSSMNYYDGDNSFYDNNDYVFVANIFSGMIEFIDSSNAPENFHNSICVHGTSFLRPANKISKENFDRIVVKGGLLKEDSYTKAKEIYNFIVNNPSKLLISYFKSNDLGSGWHTRVSVKKTGKVLWEE